MSDITFANTVAAAALGVISIEDVMPQAKRIAAEQLEIPAESFDLDLDATTIALLDAPNGDPTGIVVAPDANMALHLDATTLALLDAPDGDPTWIVEDTMIAQKENAAGVSSTAAVDLASAQAGAQVFTADGTPTSDSCQGFPGAVSEIPSMSFADIEAAISNAARTRIEAAERAIVDARERQERERRARGVALETADARVHIAKSAVKAVDEKHAEMVRRVEMFVADAAERATLLGALDAVVASERNVANDALADAEAARDEMIGESKAARLADALELQLLEQDVERWQAAAPDVVAQMRRVANAEKFARVAMDAAQRGDVKAAVRALNDARANGLAADHAATIDGVIASAKNAQALGALKARAERVLAEAEHIGAVGKIAQVERDIKAADVAGDKWFARTITAAYKKARAAKQARRAQAQPLAAHLESEGLVVIVGDGRIEAWRDESNGHRQWTLDRVILYSAKSAVWVTETPRGTVVRKDDPRKGRGS